MSETYLIYGIIVILSISLGLFIDRSLTKRKYKENNKKNM